MPVGYIRMLSCFENHALNRPKTTAVISNATRYGGTFWYSAKNQSKMWLIIASVGFYDFYVKQTAFYCFKGYLHLFLKHIHNLIIIAINLCTKRIFKNRKSRISQASYKVYYRRFPIVLQRRKCEFY